MLKFYLAAIAASILVVSPAQAEKAGFRIDREVLVRRDGTVSIQRMEPGLTMAIRGNISATQAVDVTIIPLPENVPLEWAQAIAPDQARTLPIAASDGKTQVLSLQPVVFRALYVPEGDQAMGVYTAILNQEGTAFMVLLPPGQGPAMRGTLSVISNDGRYLLTSHGQSVDLLRGSYAIDALLREKLVEMASLAKRIKKIEKKRKKNSELSSEDEDSLQVLEGQFALMQEETFRYMQKLEVLKSTNLKKGEISSAFFRFYPSPTPPVGQLTRQDEYGRQFFADLDALFPERFALRETGLVYSARPHAEKFLGAYTPLNSFGDRMTSCGSLMVSGFDPASMAIGAASSFLGSLPTALSSRDCLAAKPRKEKKERKDK